MKIWMFDHYAVPPIYYPLERPHKMAKGLIKKGHKVTIFAASTVHNSDVNLINDNKLFKEENFDSVNYVYINAKKYLRNGKDRIINILQYTSRLDKVCSNFEKPDVIVMTSFHPFACYKGIKLAKKYGIRCISYISDLWPLSLIELSSVTKKNVIYKVLYSLEKWIYKKSDAIVFTMEGGKQYIIDQDWDKENGGPVDLDKVYHINNGVDLEQFDYNKKHYKFDDEDLDDDSIFKVVYTGSIRKVNNVDQIVEVAKSIAVKNIKVKFLIYGEGTEKEKLEKYCATNNIKNVIFKGRKEKNFIPYILSKSNLNYIHIDKKDIYKYGISANKTFEYLASGKPIIIDNWVGYDYISKNGCGVMCDGDLTNIANTIIKFYKMNKKEYLEYSLCTRKTAESYDYKKLTGKLFEIIQNIV